jgi:hypothetical protein
MCEKNHSSLDNINDASPAVYSLLSSRARGTPSSETSFVSEMMDGRSRVSCSKSGIRLRAGRSSGKLEKGMIAISFICEVRSPLKAHPGDR